jgi:PAS domain S-box-containing protein
MRDKVDFEVDYRIVHPDKKVRDIHGVCHLVLGGSGEVLEHVGTVVDITERKRAEEALRNALDEIQKSESKLRQVIDAIPALAWCNLPHGPNEFLNKGWHEYTGLSAEQSHDWGWQTAFHPDDLPSLMEKWMKMLTSGEPDEIEARLRRHDGVYRWFLIRAQPFRDESGNIVRWYGTSTDIDDRKRAEEALNRARSELAHMARVTTLSALTASIAHEINQPITAATTSAGACLRWLNRDQPDVQRAREAALRIEDDARRAAEIITHLKAFYKKDVSPQREMVSVNELVGEMLVLLRSEADRHSVVMRTELADDLTSVSADRVQLQQVLMNLMLNGMEAMSERGGELTISTRCEGRAVIVSVSDTGVGIPADKMKEIFSAFVTTKLQGTGMGLAISKSIIESHSGRLWATVNSERGATFHFTLPTES